MTHGEEPGPETHKDSAVLTYLEGLLMHPVVAGPGATAGGRSQAASGTQDQSNKAAEGAPLSKSGPMAPRAGTNIGSSQHLKKARLLRSGAWSDSGNQRLSSPPAELNGRAGRLQNGAPEGSSPAGESTLLASLLQSFSSRLQSVALSQQPAKPPSGCSSPPRAVTADKEPPPAFGTASSRLKGLMRKSKHLNHHATPYSRRGDSQDRPPESPKSTHSSTPPAAPPAAEAVSCTERLKAVANLVKIRSSPAPSPKPSAACSQLALLLSSEAHLQQYSREHALKAQLLGRSASERLAAMATQQQSVGGVLETGAGHNGMTTTTTTALPQMPLSGPQSPSLHRGAGQNSPTTPPQQRDRRGFDSRPARPPQTCSSLLLLLLNNHNNQKQLTKNGHLEDIFGTLPPSGSSSVTSDSECSTHERSVLKDSSDAECSYSSCSPIDLSVRNRASPQEAKNRAVPCTSSSSSNAAFPSIPKAFSPLPSGSTLTFPPFSAGSASSTLSTSSLDKLTESLINRWKPEVSRSSVSLSKETEASPELMPHPKVTLMQLLLERRTNHLSDKSTGKLDLPLDITMATMSKSHPKSWKESRTKSPSERPVQSLYPSTPEQSTASAPYSYPPAHVQSSPLDLCKSKTISADKAPEPAFSASKLLQNLAQCGTSSPPHPAAKGSPQDADITKPHTLLDRLNAPVHRASATPGSDGASGSSTPEDAPPPSQIENLLERRTVLQLLLGTGSAAAPSSRRELPGGRGSSDLLGPRGSSDLLGPRSSSDLLEGPRGSSSGSSDLSGPGSSSRGGGSSDLLGPRGSSDLLGGCQDTSIQCDRFDSPSSDVKVKSEPAEELEPVYVKAEEAPKRKRLCEFGKTDSDSPDLKTEQRPTEVIAKYGLLSQLLKQQTATYYSSAASAEPQCRAVKEEPTEDPGPKRRRLCSEHTNRSSPNRSGAAHAEQQKNLKEDEAPPAESRGFNVLKQLLLSDNCLKELSQQPRGAPSPSLRQDKANGSIGAHSPNLLHFPSWHPHSPLNSGLPSTLRPLASGAAGQSSTCGPRTCPPPPKPPTLVKQEPKSPSQEGGEKQDSNTDSPQLSRSNPILYYMLQKGSIQLRRDSLERAQPAVRVKEEQLGDPTPPSPSRKHSHEGEGLSQSSQ